MGNSIVILRRFHVFRFVLGLAVVGPVGPPCAGGDDGARTERQLTVYVWFPIDDPGAAPLHVYDLGPGVEFLRRSL